MTDLADEDPFEIVTRADETGGEYVRFAATLYPSPDTPGGGAVLSHHRWAADNDDEHLHPNQEERMEVISGTYRVEVDGEKHTLQEGDDMVLPPNTPHRHWNPTGRPIRMIKEDRPARDSEAFFTALYVLAQAGKTDASGFPPFLQFAVLQAEYPGHAYMTDLPVGVQKALFASLAPIGRALGYSATHSLEEGLPGQSVFDEA